MVIVIKFATKQFLFNKIELNRGLEAIARQKAINLNLFDTFSSIMLSESSNYLKSRFLIQEGKNS